MKGKATKQYSKFKAAAREHGCDESETTFNAKLGKLAKVKPKPEGTASKKSRKGK